MARVDRSMWQSEAIQSPDKVMVFVLLNGLREKFGPFFIPPGQLVNQFTYHELLETQVFPLMMATLGARWDTGAGGCRMGLNPTKPAW